METSFVKPNLFILGAPKCGTTSMHSMLVNHTEVARNTIKESLYYNTYDFGMPPKHNVVHYNEHKHVMDANTHNLLCSFVPNRIKMSGVKDPKFIIMTRDPLKRAYSNWSMRYDYKKQYEYLTFENAIKSNIATYDPDIWSTCKKRMKHFDGINDSKIRTYIEEGMYYHNILAYSNAFGKESIIIVDMNALENLGSTQYSPTLNKIFTFLNLDYEEITPDKLNVGKGDPMTAIDLDEISEALDIWELDQSKLADSDFMRINQ